MTQETRRHLRFPLLAVFTASSAFGAAWLAWQRVGRLGAAEIAGLAVLLVAVLVSEYLNVFYSGSAASISMSYPLGVAIGVYFGPVYAALAGAIMALPLIFAKPRMSWAKLLFNAGQLVLTFAIPALIYEHAARLLVTGEIRATELVGLALPLAAAALLGVVVNSGFVFAALKLLYGQTSRMIWAEALAPTVASQVVLGFVGIAIAQVLAAIGIAGLALFAVPLLVARQTYQRSVRLDEAYADTISSLVAALEAKDLYTKGHSVRVAEYAVLIAKSMGIAAEHVRRIEYAALLHDVGKVGVSRRVLAKESRLSDVEYAEIKKHPAIGAHIVADVPYLMDLVPMIEHHHERFDGGGYGDGTAGTDIPIEARILAVADSYDAMTSARPYKQARSHQEALRELRDCSGTQFDPDVVAAFELGLADESAAKMLVGEAAPIEA